MHLMFFVKNMKIHLIGLERIDMNLIISGSLNKNSKSRELAFLAENFFKKKFALTEFIDLVDYEIPLCDGDECYNDKVVKKLKDKILKADSILICGPVYNYDLNAVLRNLIEVTSTAWTGKLLGFICAAGGKNSYMAPIALINNLMLHNRCLIIPRFVYASSSDFNGKDIINNDILDRIEQLVEEAIKLNGVYD